MNGSPLIISWCSVNALIQYNKPVNFNAVFYSGKPLLVFGASLGVEEFVESLCNYLDPQTKYKTQLLGLLPPPTRLCFHTHWFVCFIVCLSVC